MADFDSSMDAEIRSAADPAEARHTFIALGLGIAFSAALEGKLFESVFASVQRGNEDMMMEAMAAISRTLYAADEMRGWPWKDAANAMVARGAALELDIRRWRDKRLVPYSSWRLARFRDLSLDPEFRTFAVAVDAWTRGQRPAPPQWWDGSTGQQ